MFWMILLFISSRTSGDKHILSLIGIYFAGLCIFILSFPNARQISSCGLGIWENISTASLSDCLKHSEEDLKRGLLESWMKSKVLTVGLSLSLSSWVSCWKGLPLTYFSLLCKEKIYLIALSTCFLTIYLKNVHWQ